MSVQLMRMARRIAVAHRDDRLRTRLEGGRSHISGHGPPDDQWGPHTKAGQRPSFYTRRPFAFKEINLPTSPDDGTHPAPGLFDLFSGFLSLGLLGFGGIAPWAHHIIVERRNWLSESQYAEFIGIGQVLPGSNTVNAAILIGQRFHGALGAAIAVTALLLMPVLVVVVLASLYARFDDIPEVRDALAASAAAAAGLVMGTAIKMIIKLKLTPTAVVFGGAAAVAAGLLNVPLLLTVGILIPLSLALNIWRRR
jgi:chromate transporter